jgi:hypothetical protein
VKEDNSPVIGVGIMEQINRANAIRYNGFSKEQLENVIEAVLYDKEIPIREEDKISRRKAPW